MNGNGWRWPERWCARPGRTSSTSRSPTSTRSCGCRRGPRSSSCIVRSAATMIYVTHDQAEAMTMGDRVAVLADGRLQQVGPPVRGLRRAGQPRGRGVRRQPADEPRRRRECDRAGCSAAAAARCSASAPSICMIDSGGALAVTVSVVERFGSETVLWVVGRGSGPGSPYAQSPTARSRPGTDSISRLRPDGCIASTPSSGARR